MSIIQDIRDRYAKVAVVAIALALIGFILTDYFSGRGRGGRGQPVARAAGDSGDGEIRRGKGRGARGERTAAIQQASEDIREASD